MAEGPLVGVGLAGSRATHHANPRMKSFRQRTGLSSFSPSRPDPATGFLFEPFNNKVFGRLSLTPEDDLQDIENTSLKTIFPADSTQHTLWQIAFRKLQDVDLKIFDSIAVGFNTVGIKVASLIDDFGPGYSRTLSSRVRELVKPTFEEDHQQRDIAVLRADMIRIMVTVDEQLGLEIALIGWSCVYTFLFVRTSLQSDKP